MTRWVKWQSCDFNLNNRTSKSILFNHYLLNFNQHAKTLFPQWPTIQTQNNMICPSKNKGDSEEKEKE